MNPNSTPIKRCPKCGYANEMNADECVNSDKGPFGKTFTCGTDLGEVAGEPKGARPSVRVARGDFICIRCRSVGKPKKVTRGSFAIEVVLWLFLIVPGLVYSLWRMTSGQKRICRSCGSEEVIPGTSRLGRAWTMGRGGT